MSRFKKKYYGLCMFIGDFLDFLERQKQLGDEIVTGLDADGRLTIRATKTDQLKKFIKDLRFESDYGKNERYQEKMGNRPEKPDRHDFEAFYEQFSEEKELNTKILIWCDGSEELAKHIIPIIKSAMRDSFIKARDLCYGKETKDSQKSKA